MLTRRLQLKLYAEPGTLGDPELIVPVFHDWIRQRRLDEILVDVARYGHVQHGPAVILVGLHSDYAIDLGEGRPGLLTTRKRDAAAEDARIGDVLRHALVAADLLEKEDLGLRFWTSELVLIAPDRLNLPSSPETFEANRPEIQAEVGRLLGDVQLRLESAPAEPFTVRILRDRSEPVATVLART